jgi:hypothetical protein
MVNPPDIKVQIARQFFVALQRRGADKLLSIIESYGDTLSNAEMLLVLQEYTATGKALLRTVQATTAAPTSSAPTP